MNDFTSALESDQRALDIHRKLCEEKHASAADNHSSLGITQSELVVISAPALSYQRTLGINPKKFREIPFSSADSYYPLEMNEFTSALQSKERAIEIRPKLFRKKHASTADSYCPLGNTQYEMNDVTSALQSKEGAIETRRKLFRKKHASTADSYYPLGNTQYKMN